MSHWPVEIKGKIKVCVHPDLNQMSTYILLEQEDWFEDEMRFIRKFITDEMSAFDIGANHGVYALTMAANIKTGHVWAFEPTSSPGAMLAQSIVVNEFSDKITLVAAGLSDTERRAAIGVSDSSELNSLHGAGKGIATEEIDLFALDPFIERHDIRRAIDFVKLDAEGEEVAILRGGKTFFTDQSPLVMFELKHGKEVNHSLIEAFHGYGYDIYRLLPDMDVLVDYTDNFADAVLNLFACKPDRAAALEERGLLTSRERYKAAMPEIDRDDWKKTLFSLRFANRFEAQWLAADANLHPDYKATISAALMSQDNTLASAERVALLHRARVLLEGVEPQLAQYMSTWMLKINILHHLGYRQQCVELAGKLASFVPPGLATMELPFLPPSSRFYDRDCAGAVGPWVASQLQEYHEYRRAFSSFFAPNLSAEGNFASVTEARDLELERRSSLFRWRRGIPFSITPDHALLNQVTSANSRIWRQLATAQ